MDGSEVELVLLNGSIVKLLVKAFSYFVTIQQ